MKSAVDSGVLTGKVSRPISTHHLMHLAMLTAAACWAANMVAVKEALFGFTPLSLTLVRGAASAFVFGALFLSLRDLSLLRLARERWFRFAVIAFFGITANQILFIEGVARTNVLHAALIVAAEPIMVLVLAVSMRLEVMTALKVTGMVISFAGVLLLSYGKPLPGEQGYWVGDMILVAEDLVFAYYTILMKEVAEQYDAITLNTLIYGLGALLMIPFCAGELWSQRWTHIPVRAWLGLGFMTFFSSVIGYLLFAYALKGLTASRVAAFSYFEPVVAMALGIWLLHDRLTLRGIFGGVLILLGVYFTERERGEEPAG